MCVNLGMAKRRRGKEDGMTKAKEERAETKGEIQGEREKGNGGGEMSVVSAIVGEEGGQGMNVTSIIAAADMTGEIENVKEKEIEKGDTVTVTVKNAKGVGEEGGEEKIAKVPLETAIEIEMVGKQRGSTMKGREVKKRDEVEGGMFDLKRRDMAESAVKKCLLSWLWLLPISKVCFIDHLVEVERGSNVGMRRKMAMERMVKR
mmetsp:Transcript_3244/g.6294  ORF Transcript_3244/g.6294 Transcript_3244/m.6294 type:complete len:204 (+) Transcript_3244:844-1455(+)